MTSRALIIVGACGVMTRECGFEASAHEWDMTGVS